MMKIVWCNESFSTVVLKFNLDMLTSKFTPVPRYDDSLKASLPRPLKRGDQGGSNSVGFTFVVVVVKKICDVEVVAWARRGEYTGLHFSWKSLIGILDIINEKRRPIQFCSWSPRNHTSHGYYDYDTININDLLQILK